MTSSRKTFNAVKVWQSLRETAKDDTEIMKIFSYLNYKCQCETLTCRRLVAVREHIEDYCQENDLNHPHNEIIKELYEEEFWNHAPFQLIMLRDRLNFDPLNIEIVEKYSKQLKIYKYRIQNPTYKFPEDPTERLHEKRRIVKEMTSLRWDNYEEDNE